MNRYIIPIANINKKTVKNIILTANSEFDCQDRIIQKYADWSDSDDYDEFVEDCRKSGLYIGEINDLDTI